MQLAGVVAARRPYFPDLAGSEYEILDEINSQLNEYGQGVERKFCVEKWMSDRVCDRER